MVKYIKCVAALLVLLSASSVLAINSQILNPESGDTKSLTQDQNREVFANPVKRNRVHTAGLLWLNMTNFGVLGAQGKAFEYFKEQCSGKKALGAELPGGSKVDYLYSAGMWFGGYLDSAVVDGAIRMEGPHVTTGDEGWVNPQTNELHPTAYASWTPGDPAKKALIVETSNIKGRVNCFYDPVYDASANAHEQLTTSYTDRSTDPSYVKNDDIDKLLFPNLAVTHIPLGIEVKQTSYAWSSKFAQKLIIIDYTIYNINETKSIYNLFMGSFFDNDIGKYMPLDSDPPISEDDMGGFKTYAKVKDEATGERVTVPINMAWVADNDGRDPFCGANNNIESMDGCERPVGYDLDGATSIFTLRVLRNPNPALRYSFNYYNAAGSASIQNEEPNDWSPRWKDGLHDQEFIDGVYNVGWFGRYDISYEQKGYSDGKPGDAWGIRMNRGGMTEGRALGDRGRYMLMANGERDYDMTSLLVHPDMNEPNDHLATFPVVIEDPVNTEPIYKQQHKFRPFITGANEQNDGSAARRNELGNGCDDKFVVSYGPLGTEDNINILTQSGPVNKKVWKFAPKDSIKLTVAFIVSENFHTWKGQDGRNPDFSDENGKVNWGDCFRNAVWADRLYDVPMYDSKVFNKATGKAMRDGWFGEDVGKDATYAIKKEFGASTCLWNNQLYSSPDDGEGNFKLDTFTVAAAFGNNTCEDNLLQFGNANESGTALFAIADSIGSSKDYGFLYKQNVAPAGSLVPDFKNVRFGWNDKLISTGDGVPDFLAPEAPPSPKIQVSTEGNDVTIVWQTDNFGSLSTSPEKLADRFSNLIDFEGYQIWLSNTSNLKDFVEVFSVDKKNFVYQNETMPSELLDIPFSDANKYLADGVTPNPAYSPYLADGITTNPAYILNSPYAPNIIWPARANGASFNPLKPDSAEYVVDIRINPNGGVDTTTAVVKNATAYSFRKVPFGNNKLLTQDQTAPDLIEYKATFLKEQNGTRIYEYKAILKNKLFGKKQYVAVTSGDFGDPKSKVDPLKSSPAMNATPFVPGKISSSDKVIVVPNPYRADVNYEAAGFEIVPDTWKEIDRKILFLNVPKHSVIRIYTLAGDLVKTIAHNGSASDADREGEYASKWNLLNQNDQAVASGVYLFAVEDKDGVREKFVGKFVIIK